MSTPIDLSRLPVPPIIEVIDYEDILAERKARLLFLTPAAQKAEMAATLELESEPIVKLLQENAYREVGLRQRVNDAAKGMMLAFAAKADLDHLAAGVGVERLVVTPADPEQDLPAVMEEDPDLRRRTQLAPESFSVAGPKGAYISLALNADARVLDAAVKSPVAGQVLVTVLSREGDGTASPELLGVVLPALSPENKRPLGDEVIVQSAQIVDYQVMATIYTSPGPDAGVVVAESRKRLDAYIAKCHEIGGEVAISGLHGALHVDGIKRVVLTLPLVSIQTTDTQAPDCSAITILYGGVSG